MVDQGQTVRVHGGNGSAFVTTGRFLLDNEYRFAIKGRLNQVNTRSALKRMHQRNNAICRFPPCSNQETLAHVLNHCTGNMDHIRHRHDSALEKIHQAVLKSTERAKRQCAIRINQTVPDYPGPALRPDIQIYEEATKTAIISDLAVTFEKQPNDERNSSTLQCSRDMKLLKYGDIKKHLETRGWSVKLSALTYGSLGSTTKENLLVLWKDLQLRKRDAINLDKDLSTHNIKASHKIWCHHQLNHDKAREATNRRLN
jgi:hypothetical protein